MTVRFSPRAVVLLLAAALAAAAFLLIGRPALARNGAAPTRQQAPVRTVTVNGHGETAMTPDQATLEIGVETRGQDAASALSDNSTRMQKVIAAIEAQGIPASHLQTANLSIYYDSQTQSYVADNQLTVTIDSVNTVGGVIDAAVGAGANNSWGISFGLKDPSAARSAALQAAVADARRRADALASALGVSISGVVSVQEQGTTIPPPVAYTAAKGAAPTPVQPGTMNVTSDVTITYSFS